jgi:prophage tail gpP-like protein
MRERHVLSTDNAKGELVFIKVGSSGRCTTKLELGQNIRSASSNLDYSGVFSEYTCLGQSTGTDETEPDVFTTGFSSTQSTLIKRKRVLVLVQSGDANSGVCKERVEYEKAHRAAKALETDYVVSGWREESGTLWQPNKLVQVRDGMIGFDTEMLIVGVSYILDANGQRTEIKVGPPDGYKTKAEKKQATQGWADVQK